MNQPSPYLKSESELILERFTPRDFEPWERAAAGRIRDEFTRTAATVVGLLPAGRARSLALTALEEAKHWAVAAISETGILDTPEHRAAAEALGDEIVETTFGPLSDADRSAVIEAGTIALDAIKATHIDQAISDSPQIMAALERDDADAILASVPSHDAALRSAGRKLALEPLTIPFEHPDAPGTGTLGEYLAELLTRLLEEGEGFDPKRPFGNSGWQDDIEDALDQAGFETSWAPLNRAIEAALEGTR